MFPQHVIVEQNMRHPKFFQFARDDKFFQLDDPNALLILLMLQHALVIPFHFEILKTGYVNSIDLKNSYRYSTVISASLPKSSLPIFNKTFQSNF